MSNMLLDMLQTIGNYYSNHVMLETLCQKRNVMSTKIQKLQKEIETYKLLRRRQSRRARPTDTKIHLPKSLVIKEDEDEMAHDCKFEIITRKEKDHQIVCNYLRTIEVEMNNIIPDDVYQVCFKYYHCISLQFYAINLYAQLFREIFKNPSILSIIYHNPRFEHMNPICNFLCNSLLSNPFDTSHEYVLTKIIQDVMTFEFETSEDLTTYLRENTCAVKLLGFYLKREPIANLIKNTVNEIVEHCLQDYKEDLEIDPDTIWEKHMNEVASELNLSPRKLCGPDDPNITDLCNKRKNKLMEYLDFILSKIMDVSIYPISLRIICRKLRDLAKLREPNHPELQRIVNSLIGGFLFLRIFNPKIAYYGISKSKTMPYKLYSSNIRRKYTLIVIIIQRIVNQSIYCTKERYMRIMKEYMSKKVESMSNFFDKLCDIPSLNEYICLNSQILKHSLVTQSVYISIKDLTLLSKVFDPAIMEYNNVTMDQHINDLISEIIAKRAFLNMDTETMKATFVSIAIPKHDVFNRQSLTPCLETHLKVVLIPVLYGISQRIDLIQNFENKGQNLVANTTCIELLQLTQKCCHINGLQSAINTLLNYPNRIIEEFLMKWCEEAKFVNNIFGRISKEVEEMIAYHQLLVQNKNELFVNMKTM